MISKTGTLAIRALMALSELPESKYAGAIQIAKQLKAPANYLSKLLQSLCRAGIVESQKGLGGGFRLVKEPEKVTLYDIIEPVEQVGKWERCIMGRASCSDSNPCTLHHKWADISGRYITLLKTTTLSDLRKNGKHSLHKIHKGD